MTISIWRYSHLVLAIVSAIFLLVASLTGIILAFEPIVDATQSYKTANLNKVSLAETITVLQENYDEVLELEIDANDFVITSVITNEGTSERIYINPISSKKIGIPKEKATLFKWATNLHRSLFLKSIGRVFVGFVSFLLCFITVTGFILLIKRQGGFLKLFSKVQKEYIALRYHVILGKWLMLPILLIGTTGVYLSAEKFALLPKNNLPHEITEFQEGLNSEKNLQELPIFKNIYLNRVRHVLFPFSKSPEDYFEVALDNKELYINQYTGSILSEVEYPITTLLSRFSLTIHTGQGSILWSLTLLVTSGSLLFFMFSGFTMSLKRRKKIKPITVQQDKDQCEYIILVGSETGSTNEFATLFQNALTKAGKSVFKSELNTYTLYKNAKYIIVFTATYGEGDAPTNARKFKNIFAQKNSNKNIKYCVLGFGSLVYPNYCQFAIDVDTIFKNDLGFKALLPIRKINNQSFEGFKNWVSTWSEVTKTPLLISPFQKNTKTLKTNRFKVIYKSDLNNDATFLIRLRPEKSIKFQSGDLLACLPNKNQEPRLYSIAKINNDILLSIKKHKLGLCSTYLSSLTSNEIIHAAIQKNEKFHFPTDAKQIICIANGTGIAPFLGIIAENEKHIPIHLFWGGKTKASFSTYKTIIDGLLKTKKLSRIDLAYSQEYKEKVYVQDLLLEAQGNIAKKLESGTVFMICGAIAMQHEVLNTLESIALEKLNTPLSEFEYKKQLKIDCY